MQWCPALFSQVSAPLAVAHVVQRAERMVWVVVRMVVEMVIVVVRVVRLVAVRMVRVVRMMAVRVRTPSKEEMDIERF